MIPKTLPTTSVSGESCRMSCMTDSASSLKFFS